MLGLFILFALFGIGFGAGYGTREIISRRRRADYLMYEPYLAPSRKPLLENSAAHSKAAARPRAERTPVTEDITRSFREVPIRTDKPTRPALHVVRNSANGKPTLHRAEEGLEELIRRLGREHLQR